MAFISLMFMMVFLVMAAVGLVFLLIAMIFFLINRHRLKKGKRKKRRYKIVGIIFLVLSGINLAPILFMTFLSVLMTVVGMLVDEEYTPVTYPIIGVVGLVLLAVAYGIRRWSRHRYQEGEKPGRGTRIVFRFCLFLGDISLVPALIEGGNRVSDHIKLAVMPECAEMWIYQPEHDGSEEDQDDWDEEEETEKLFLSDSDWITDEMLNSVENEEGQTFPAPEKYYELHMTGMDGIVSGECDIAIGKYEDKWYYYSKYDYLDQEGCVISEEDQLYVMNGCLLPEKAQHYMDTLE